MHWKHATERSGVQLDSAVPSWPLRSAWLQGQQLLAMREGVSVRIDAPAAAHANLSCLCCNHKQSPHVAMLQTSEVTCRLMTAVVLYQQVQYLVETAQLQSLLPPLGEAYCDERAAGCC